MCPGGRKDAGGWQSPRFQNERSRGEGRLCSIPVFLDPFIACQSCECVSRNTFASKLRNTKAASLIWRLGPNNSGF